MKIGPRYKKARRLGAHVFEKTSTAKFSVHLTKRKANPEGKRAKTDYGNLMLDKQRVRVTYGLNERQFKNMVKGVIAEKTLKPSERLFETLESRLDNVVLRGGFAHTRALARQLTAHGHIIVNGVKTMVPSRQMRKGDVVTIREASSKKPVFATLDEKLKTVVVPAWLKLDKDKKSITVEGAPKALPGESHLNLAAVVQYYRR
ncbi:MAG: 30S ribosomal protein S4 [bacterium]